MIILEPDSERHGLASIIIAVIALIAVTSCLVKVNYDLAYDSGYRAGCRDGWNNAERFHRISGAK